MAVIVDPVQCEPHHLLENDALKLRQVLLGEEMQLLDSCFRHMITSYLIQASVLKFRSENYGDAGCEIEAQELTDKARRLRTCIEELGAAAADPHSLFKIKINIVQ